MESLWQDLRLGLRSLAKSPGFTAAAVLTLTLGIGANAAIFSIVYGVLHRPLPYRDAASLVLVTAKRDFAGELRPATFSAFEIADWTQRSHTLASLAGHSSGDLALEGRDAVEPLTGSFVSETFFSTIGQPPSLGRLVGPEDDLSPVAVISHRLWRRLFDGHPSAIGGVIKLSSRKYTVVGVAAPDFRFPSDRVDVWTPMGEARQSDLAPWLGNRRGGGVSFVARLRPGSTVAEAHSDLEDLGRRLARERPDVNKGVVPVVTPVVDSVAGAVRPALQMLFAAVVLVLLVAAANVANLLLARHAVRRHDIAVRLALGASRRRLVAHAMAESTILGASGGLGGILLAMGIIRTLVWLGPAQLPRLDAIRVDTPVLAFAVATAVAATLAASLGPAIQSSRLDPAVTLRATARMARSARAGRLRSVLVAAELAVSIVLMVGASVLARSFVRLLHTEIGAQTDHVVVARVNLALGRKLTEPQQRLLGAALIERVKALPGIRSAALSSALPPSGRMAEITLREVPTARGIASEYQVNAAPATADFFATLGIPLRQGRLFNETDDAAHERVMIVSADVARDLFGDHPIGRTLSLPTPQRVNATARVVGVVGNVSYKGLAEPAEPTIYVPFAQQPWTTAFLVARTTGEPMGVAADLRHAIGQVDRQIGVVSVRALDDVLAEETAQPGFRTAVLCAVAALAVALAAIGLSGLVGYSVSKRTAEIGVRVALGAGRGDVLWMVLRQGLLLGGVGATVGLAAAFGLTRVLASFLFGVTATDPPSFALAAVVLMVVVLAASYLPARRASRLDPIVALRAE
jgi:putative ABC transport system permease protein